MMKQDRYILVWMEELTAANKWNREGGHAVDKINLRVDAGELVCISGLYGTDKISFINTLSCLERPYSGKYIFDYNDTSTIDLDKLNELRGEIGMMFRDLNLLETKTVYQNIGLPLSFRKQEGVQAKITEAAQWLGIEALMSVPLSKLSVLEKHKVSLARAMVVKPHMIIADEPALGLTQSEAEELLYQLKELNAKGTAIVCFSEREFITQNAARHIIFEQGLIKTDSGLTAIDMKGAAI